MDPSWLEKLPTSRFLKMYDIAQDTNEETKKQMEKSKSRGR